MDVRITETGNGGDLTLGTNDLIVAAGIENMPYLSMFGGSGFWGNDLLLTGEGQKFDATTQAALDEVPLNSQGRVTIENAMRADMQNIIDQYPETTLQIQTKITDDNKLEASILMNGEEVNSLWNPFVPEKKSELKPPPYRFIYESPLRTGITERYAITEFSLISGEDTADFPAAVVKTLDEEAALITSYNTLAVSQGMAGVFQVQGTDIVYLEHVGESWDVDTAPVVLHQPMDIRIKSIGAGAATWAYRMSGIGSYVVTDWQDGTPVTSTHPTTVSITDVTHTFDSTLESRNITIYHNDTLVLQLRFSDTSGAYRVKKIFNRPPASIFLYLMNLQAVDSIFSVPLDGCSALDTLSFGANGFTGFSPELLAINLPSIRSISLQTNKLSSSEVDKIFNLLVSNSPECLTRIGNINLAGQTPSAPPTSASATARASLLAAGWLIFTD